MDRRQLMLKMGHMRYIDGLPLLKIANQFGVSKTTVSCFTKDPAVIAYYHDQIVERWRKQNEKGFQIVHMFFNSCLSKSEISRKTGVNVDKINSILRCYQENGYCIPYPFPEEKAELEKKPKRKKLYVLKNRHTGMTIAYMDGVKLRIKVFDSRSDALEYKKKYSCSDEYFVEYYGYILIQNNSEKDYVSVSE